MGRQSMHKKLKRKSLRVSRSVEESDVDVRVCSLRVTQTEFVRREYIFLLVILNIYV